MMISEFFGRAWSAFVTRLIAYSPTVLATLALIAVGFVVSWLLALLASRVTRRLGLDERLRDTGFDAPLARAGFHRSTSTVIGRLVFWLVFLCFLVLALENLGFELSALPVRSFVAYVPRLIGAVILLMAGVLLATLLGRATAAGLARMGVRPHERLGGIVRWTLVALTVVATIDHLGFDVELVTRTFGNLVTIVAAGIVLAFAWGGREVARNVLAGYYVRENFTPGDIVAVDGHAGRLREIGALHARLETESGSVTVPNSRLVEQTVETRRESS